MIPVFQFNQLLLIVLFYIKFLFQILLKYDPFLLDICLYILLLLSLNIFKINWHLLAIVFFAILSQYNSATRNFFLILFSVYILKNWSLRHFAVVNLVCGIVFLGIVSFLLAFGLLKVKMFDLYLLDDRERWDFGFGNPNTFALFMYSILLNAYILYINKWKTWFPLLLAIISIGIFSYTGSRTFLISIMILIGLHYYLLIRKKIRFIKIICIVWPFLFMGVLLFFSFNAEEFKLLNLAMSGRLKLYNEFMSNLSYFDFLIGNSKVNELDSVIDSFYLQVLFQGGAMGVGYMFYLNYAAIKNIKYDSRFLLPVLLSIWAYGIGESIGVFVLIYGNMIFWLILFKNTLQKPKKVNIV